MKTIKINTVINAPIEVCFDLARSVEVHLSSTAHTHEQAVAGRTSGLCLHGDTITWRARHFGIYQHLTVKITELQYPTHFQDQMVKGAFKSFTHDHFFSRQAGKTLMQDVFTFTAPFGALGRLVETLLLKKYMESLLIRRNAVIKELAESGGWQKILEVR